MPIKGQGPAAGWQAIDRFDGGVGWLAYPDEAMGRASHALIEDGDLWLVDPVDAQGIDEWLAEHGTVAGVVVLLDRHRRDAAAFARRHDVSVHVPRPLDGVGGDVDAPTEPFRHDLADTGYTAHPVVDRFRWREAALYSDRRDTLVVADAFGTSDFYSAPGERLGVHPMLRIRPPAGLARLAPDRLLVGHGEGIHEDATGAIDAAIRGSLRRLPRLAVRNLRLLAGG